MGSVTVAIAVDARAQYTEDAPTISGYFNGQPQVCAIQIQFSEERIGVQQLANVSHGQINQSNQLVKGESSCQSLLIQIDVLFDIP